MTIKNKIISITEIILSLLVFVGTINFGVKGTARFLSLDWSLNPTFYQFISFVLLVLVGLELIRLILSHNISTVLELMILIIARKTLDPNIDSTGIFLSMISLGIVVIINYLYEHKPLKSLQDLTQ